jgi:exo-beta-1,3-glucanase (GH17 family)
MNRDRKFKMKTGLFSIACVALLRFAVGQPHGTDNLVDENTRQNVDLRKTEKRHQRHHQKRQQAVVTDTVTDIEYVTYEYEDVIVYVDANDNPVSTTTVYKNLVGTASASTPSSTPSSTPAAPPPPPSSTPAPQPAPSPAPAPKASSAPPAPPPAPVSTPSQPQNAPPPAKQSSPSSSPPPSSGGGEGGSSSGPGFGSAISYTPYNADNSCKSTQQVATDLQQATPYEVIRLYGTDCNQVANVIAATGGKVSLFLGIFDINSIQSEVQTISSAINGKWSLVNTVSVGNELVNSGAASAGQVTAAIGTAKAALKSAGYSGPVVTVDTMTAIKNNIELCTASDFCAINCHAFFDGNTLPSGAGDFVKNWAEQISQAAGGKTTVVTESGWPTQGDHNNKAVPSQENHQTAISSLKASFGGGTNLVLYGLYNGKSTHCFNHKHRC